MKLHQLQQHHHQQQQQQQHGWGGSYAGSPYQYGAAFRGTPFQYGGLLPGFAGSTHQYGFGLGDVLRGVMRKIVPYIWPFAKQALSSFAFETSRNLDQNKPIGESMKGALWPALKSGLGGVVDEAKRQRKESEGAAQSGHGRRRVYKGKKQKIKRRKIDVQFGGRGNF